MSMTCKIATDIAELYYEGLVSPETARAVRRHLGGCKNCRNYYHQYEAIRKNSVRPAIHILPDEEITETEKRLYINLSEKLRRRRFWNLVGTSAAIGAGSVMLTVGLLLTCKKVHSPE